MKKALKDNVDNPETLAVLKKADALATKEKALKKQVKDESAALHLRTKKTIEGLSDDEARKLLKRKWIDPLVKSLTELPNAEIRKLTASLEALCAKYETTLASVEGEIRETETALAGMLDELRGSEYDMKGIAELKALLKGE